MQKQSMHVYTLPMIMITTDSKISNSIFVFELSVLLENIQKHLLRECEHSRVPSESICLDLGTGIAPAGTFFKFTKAPSVQGEGSHLI